MKAVFNIRETDGEANISPATIRAFDELPPIIAADFAKDIMNDAVGLYNRQVERLRAQLAGKS